MSTLSLLGLITPLFGFMAPSAGGQLVLSPPPNSLLNLPVLAQSADDGDAADAEAPAAARADAPAPSEAAPPAGAVDADPTLDLAIRADQDEDAGPSEPGTSDLAQQLRERQSLADIHRAFGIATWGAMLITEVLGGIQYYNLYGFGGTQADNPCVNGNAVFGQDQCYGIPLPHLITASITSALYATTFTLSFLMPDPLHADEGDSAFANNLRIHEMLRWVHFGGMVAQILLGVVAANATLFGIPDRANDFGANQALATVHEAIGIVTFGALTAAGAIMLF